MKKLIPAGCTARERGVFPGMSAREMDRAKDRPSEMMN